MKKIMWMAVLVIVIFLAGTVLGYTITILTNQQFRNAYPDDPLVRTIQDCGGRSEAECIGFVGRDMTCKVIAETTAPDGKPILKFRCFE